jgi:hypothetical protein
MTSKARALAAWALVSLQTACLSGEWWRDNREAPVPEAALAGLRPGQTDLTDCLSTLGAPLRVWEYRGNGMALAYGWHDHTAWGFTVTVPVQKYVDVSFEYDHGNLDLPAVLLLFDTDLRLLEIRRGILRDIAGELIRRRPNRVEDA